MEPRFSQDVLSSYEKTPRVGLEPTTPRLTAVCSTIELSRIIEVYIFKTAHCVTSVTDYIWKSSLMNLPYCITGHPVTSVTRCHLLRKCRTKHSSWTAGTPALIPSVSCAAYTAFWSNPRPISNGQLHALLHFHLRPIYLVVFKGSYFFRMGHLILRGASRLDAFSVYPFWTWLLCHASGNAADTPAVRPSRSSRTKDSSSQISYAHAG